MEKWEGPFKIGKLLDELRNRPGKFQGVYVVTERGWNGARPLAKAKPLYVGGQSSMSRILRPRLGDLIADLFGFFDPDAIGRKSSWGHHSGGARLFCYCVAEGIKPSNLYLAWRELSDGKCVRCAEIALFEKYQPLLNAKRPSACKCPKKSKAKSAARASGIVLSSLVASATE